MLTYLLFFIHIFCSINLSEEALAPALYVFGDSLHDSGNNNFLPTVARANFLPYGKDFPDGITGRFTNGRTVADFIAEYLELPYVPSYVSMNQKPILTGYNYASGSCGILKQSGSQHGVCLNLEEQLDMFEYTVNFLLPILFESISDKADYLSKSIFIITMGSNDYINNYYEPKTNTRNKYTPQEFAKLLIDKLHVLLQRLYDLGARKVMMYEVGPVGCMPTFTRSEIHGGQCIETMNQEVSIFNVLLAQLLTSLGNTLEGSNFVLGTTYAITYDAIMNPLKYGIMDSVNPCCVTWQNGTSACIPFLPPCLSSNQHMFFDGFHFTEAGYTFVASHFIYGSDSVSEIDSIKKLISM